MALLALAYEQTGQPERAAEVARAALEAAPASPWAPAYRSRLAAARRALAAADAAYAGRPRRPWPPRRRRANRRRQPRPSADGLRRSLAPRAGRGAYAPLARGQPVARNAPKARNARYRPFRALALGVYLVVVVTFSVLVIVSVVRSVLEMTPRQPLNAIERLGPAECAVRAQELYEQLETRRQDLSAVQPAAEASLALDELPGGVAERAAPGARPAAPRMPWRRDVFSRLETLENLYTTSAVQYSGEMGPGGGRLPPGPDPAARRRALRGRGRPSPSPATRSSTA